MHPSEVDSVLETLKVVVDTREQDTQKLRDRLALMALPYERKKLNYGDYSASIEIDGDVIYLDKYFVIERKMNADELAQCFTRDRARFTREFERAKKAGAKTYLLVENTSWENIIAGRYRSKMLPQSYIASLTTWLARYDCQIIFVGSVSSGLLIREILKREAKEYLNNLCE